MTSGAQEVAGNSCPSAPGIPSTVSRSAISSPLPAIQHGPSTVRDAGAGRTGGQERHGALGIVIGRYRTVPQRHLPADEAARRFLELVSRDMNVISLLETARFYEDCGNPGRGSRMVLPGCTGRISWPAGSLRPLPCRERGRARMREGDAVYPLQCPESTDLTKVASIIVRETGRMRSMKRLMENLIRKLEDRRTSLGFRRAGTAGHCFFHCRVQCSGRGRLRGLQVSLPLRDGRNAVAHEGDPARRLSWPRPELQGAVHCRSPGHARQPIEGASRYRASRPGDHRACSAWTSRSRRSSHSSGRTVRQANSSCASSSGPVGWSGSSTGWFRRRQGRESP